MKKNGHKLFTLVALLGTAAGVIHIANRFIDATSQLKDMLEQPHSKTYNWRFGKIHYTKQGHGAPLLLVHDMMPGASGYEWSSVEKQLATEHTVYTLDLLGCGRSEAGYYLHQFCICSITLRFCKKCYSAGNRRYCQRLFRILCNYGIS